MRQGCITAILVVAAFVAVPAVDDQGNPGRAAGVRR